MTGESPRFIALSYACWGALCWSTWWAYSSSSYLILLMCLLIHVWQLWGYLMRPQPRPRGPLVVDKSSVPATARREATDLTKWHLEVDRGRQVWHYGTTAKQTVFDRYVLGLDKSPQERSTGDLKSSLKSAMEFYATLQTEDGHWANDYGGPHFLLPDAHKTEIIRYLTSEQNEDGGWGLHIEAASGMFGTVLTYVTMRLLGVVRADPRMARAREWLDSRGTLIFRSILIQGGAVSIPAWGKFWLATLGLYEWEGLIPVVPELWALPYWLPFHPGRWWCHCRVVYLPMAYMFGSRDKFTFKPNSLIKELREELYLEVYETIDWVSHRNHVFQDDAYKGHSIVVDIAFSILSVYESFQWLFPFIRRYSLAKCIDHIRYEDSETHGISIGPVNKCMDMLCEFWASNGKSELFKLHQERLVDYLWISEDGMKMQGYNGSQLWDTAFSLQAFMDSGMADDIPAVASACRKGYNYVDITQVRENNRDHQEYYRHISKGAWPFSTRDHGWPISDCTSEGLACAMLMPRRLNDIGISDDRIFDAVNVLLSYQNTDGGWPSYENMRGPALLELLNPADLFDNIMVDYSYVECSSTCMRILLEFSELYPNHRHPEILAAVARGIEFLCNIQKPDGGWHGCWAVCYTYSAWFAIPILSKCLELGIGKKNRIELALKRGVEFLLKHQHADGGWGEDFRSCVEKRYVDLPAGHVVQTSWVVIALLSLQNPPLDVIERGVRYLMRRQLKNGDWNQEPVVGVFNYNCAISYSGYKNIFSIWAMGRYLNQVGNLK